MQPIHIELLKTLFSLIEDILGEPCRSQLGLG